MQDLVALVPKVKERSSEEFFRGKIRELEKENKSLKRRVKELEKYDRTIETTSDLLREHGAQLKRLAEYDAVKHIDSCPKCFNGIMELKFTLREKDYMECNSCDFRYNRISRGN